MKVFLASVVAMAAWRVAGPAWEHVVHNVALEIAIIAAGAAGTRELWRRVCWPALRSVMLLGLKAEIDGIHAQLGAIEERLGEGAEQFDRIEGTLALLVSADRQQVAAALEGRPPRTGWRE